MFEALKDTGYRHMRTVRHVMLHARTLASLCQLQHQQTEFQRLLPIAGYDAGKDGDTLGVLHSKMWGRGNRLNGDDAASV